MEPSDVTIKILQEIRDEGRRTREGVSGLREEISGLRTEMTGMRAESSQRFEIIETTLRDLAQQMVMLARGI